MRSTISPFVSFLCLDFDSHTLFCTFPRHVCPFEPAPEFPCVLSTWLLSRLTVPIVGGRRAVMSLWAACTVWLLGTHVNEFLCGHVFICLVCSWTALLSNVQMRTHTRLVFVPLDAFLSLPCLTSWPQNPPLLGAGRVLQLSRDLLD